MSKFCIECGETISGRADKKFCTDVCRNSYNNKVNSDANNYMRNINHVLRKNRRTLSELCVGDKITVPAAKLTENGFLFTYYTHSYRTRKGDVYYFCYEYGYIRHPSEMVTIVARKPKNEQTDGKPEELRISIAG